MRIALVEEESADQVVRSAELRRALEARGHRVERRGVSDAQFAAAERERFALRRRLARRWSGAPTLPQAWEIVAEQVGPWVRRSKPDLVLARGSRAALAALPADETPFAVDLEGAATLRLALRWYVDGPDLEATHRREAAVLQRAAVVAVPHEGLGRLLGEAFPATRGLADRLVVMRDGITRGPQRTVARNGAVVCLHPVTHGDDPLLLAALQGRLGRPLRRIGAPGPAVSFLPDPSAELGADEAVSFGLVTRLADRLSRACGHKVGRLLESGVPVLAPRWLAIDPALEPAVARYEEATFEADVAAAFARFGALRDAAAAVQGSWDAALEPFLARLGP